MPKQTPKKKKTLTNKKPTSAAAPEKGKEKPSKGLTVTLRLTPELRRKVDQTAKSSGVSANAVIQQLVDLYGHKLDLGPRVDLLEERVGQIEYALKAPANDQAAASTSTLGFSAKLAANHERIIDIHVQLENDGNAVIFGAVATIGKPNDPEGNEPYDEITGRGDTFLDMMRNLNEALDKFFDGEATERSTEEGQATSDDGEPEDEEERDLGGNSSGGRADNASGPQTGDEND